MQFGIGDALAGNMAHRLQSGTPIRAAHVHQYAIHVEDQDFRLQFFFHGAGIHLKLWFSRQRGRNARGSRRKM